MLDSILRTDISGNITLTSFLICLTFSLVLGIVISFIYMHKNNYTKGFVVAIAILPAMVQVVIMLVNGNIGAGVAVMGAFGLIRFRSVPGSARDIGTIFFAMATGLATGMGYIWLAVLFILIVGGVNIILNSCSFGNQVQKAKNLRITIPENLEYSALFDDLFEKYTYKHELIKVKTTNMGSMYQLEYNITLKDSSDEKKFIDDIRCRNGNLTIICGYAASVNNEL